MPGEGTKQKRLEPRAGLTANLGGEVRQRPFSSHDHTWSLMDEHSVRWSLVSSGCLVHRLFPPLLRDLHPVSMVPTSLMLKVALLAFKGEFFRVRQTGFKLFCEFSGM